MAWCESGKTIAHVFIYCLNISNASSGQNLYFLGIYTLCLLKSTVVHTMYSDSRLLNIYGFLSPCIDLPFPVFISPQYRWANTHLLCKAFWKLQTRGTPLPWKITLLCSVYPLVQPLHPREPCELHFQAGVATAAAGLCHSSDEWEEKACRAVFGE